MDEKKLETLILIQEAVAAMLKEGQISIADAGKQLLMVAADYLEVDEVILAREVLYTINQDYFKLYLPDQRTEDVGFGKRADLVDDVFYLEYFRPVGGHS